VEKTGEKGPGARTTWVEEKIREREVKTGLLRHGSISGERKRKEGGQACIKSPSLFYTEEKQRGRTTGKK